MTQAATVRNPGTSDPIDRVLDALRYTGPRPRSSYKCICPAHEDRNPSLSVTEKDDGTVLIKCHAGCTTDAVLRAMGLTGADLRPAPRSKSSRAKDKKIIATYDYRDERGALLYQAVRFDPKGFAQRRPNGKGGYVWSLGTTRRVLYKLPDLLAASADHWIFVVEGEKDADALIGRGLVATTNAMGAGKWIPEYNQSLQGRKVCVIPDNDDSGRLHAQNVAAQLLPLAKQIRVLALPDLPSKGDVSDWLANGGTISKLFTLVEAEKDYSAPATTDTGAKPTYVEYSDLANAEYAYSLYKDRIIYNGAYGWLRNIGTHWMPDGAEAHAQNLLNESLRKQAATALATGNDQLLRRSIPDSRNTKNALYQFKSLVTVSLDTFDNDPNVLNCANGVVNLRTGKLVTHDPSNRFTYCVQTPYMPQASRDAWIAFLAATADAYNEIADWLQMAFGYSITGQTREECLFYIEGPARSGKGTFTNTLLTLLGQPLARAVDFNTFTQPRDGNSQNFDLAPLRTARFIAASESGRHSALNEAVVKNITGNDPITAAFKHRDIFTYSPTFKIWMTSNHPVKGDVDDDAFWGRVRVIRFPNSHLDNEDKGLKWRMSSPDMLPGILAWAVEGARRWYDAGSRGLQTPFPVTAATQSHRAELDHVQLWLNEESVPAPDGAVTVPNLYQSYKHWCEENGQTPKLAAAFGRALIAKGFEQTRKRIGDTTQRAYKGLILRSSLVQDE